MSGKSKRLLAFRRMSNRFDAFIIFTFIAQVNHFIVFIFLVIVIQFI